MRYTHPDMDPAWLHEAGRHTVHSSETISVARDIVYSMLREHEQLQPLFGRTDLPTNRFIQQRLHSHAQILGALKVRSDANIERLKNENSLVCWLPGDEGGRCS